MNSDFTVCLVGRPNVGKSTLFNKLTRSRNAIVDNTPGVTRDRLFGQANLDGVDALLIDTGGFEPVSEDEIVSQVKEQALLAIEEADTICFVLDGRAGVTNVDMEIADVLRKSGKPTVLAVNKLDTTKQEDAMSEFYTLGFENVVAVSAEHSIGFTQLCGALTDGRDKTPIPEETEDNGDEVKPFTIAVVGMPNVGKSSLVNRMLGKKRLMVSDIPGTTRDSIDTTVTWYNREFVFIDTAGIRRKNKISRRLEKYSVIMALKSIARAELVLLLIDAKKGITDQDVRVAGVIQDKARACIIVVNKWDLVEKDSNSTERFKEEMSVRLKFLWFAPVLFISAKSGQRVAKIYETIDEVMKEYQKRVDTGPLNRKVKRWVSIKPPPVSKGHRAKFFYISQFRASPPTFNFVVSRPECVPAHFRRYIANRLREEYGFIGAPLVCNYRPRKRR